MGAFLCIGFSFILYSILLVIYGDVSKNISEIFIMSSIIFLYAGLYFISITPLNLAVFKNVKNIIKLFLFAWLLLIYLVEFLFIPQPEFMESGIILIIFPAPVKIIVGGFLFLIGVLNIFAWVHEYFKMKEKKYKLFSLALIVAYTFGITGILLIVLSSVTAKLGFLGIALSGLHFIIAIIIKRRFHVQT